MTRSALLEFFNSWCPGIIITNDEFEGSVNTTFLDLSISRLGSLFVYSTYRKSLNSYAYLPFSSNHSLAVKSGIVATECCRLLVTNRYSTTFQAQLNFFAQKLQDRGYPIGLIQSVFERYPWNKKAELLARRRFEKCAVVPLKLN